MTELETTNHKFRKSIPESHRGSLDTRVAWLWNQRFGVVQRVYLESPDEFDRLAATLFLQAIVESDLKSVELIFQRVEGALMTDTETAERNEAIRI